MRENCVVPDVPYRFTIQSRTSATSTKLGVRKLSTEMRRGYPRARIISVKFRSSRYDIVRDYETQRGAQPRMQVATSQQDNSFRFEGYLKVTVKF
jgi:hypothetical protein